MTKFYVKTFIVFLVLLTGICQAQIKLEISRFGSFNEGLLSVRKGSKAAFYDLSGNKINDYKIDIGIKEADFGGIQSPYPMFSNGLCKAYDPIKKNVWFY